MRPVELTVDGFRSYGKPTTFSWSERGLVGVVGPIGSGKSSILDAIAFALYARVPAFERDVILKFRGRSNPDRQVQPIVSITRAGALVTFALNHERQPVARVPFADGVTVEQDVAALSRFAGQIQDMTPYVTRDGRVHLAATDTRHHLWTFHGSIDTGSWSAVDRTVQTGAPGITGDLTTYQPSWGAIHVVMRPSAWPCQPC